MSMPEYDGIIIGAGHNGLILQAYLGKAGLKTICIERRPVAGGGLSTVEDPRHPGFLHNTHAFFQRAITTMPWYADLELERHGAHYIEPELNVALLTRDGGALEWWTDIDRTVASFGEFSRRDAETLRRWQHEFVPILRDILIPESRSVPMPPEERRSAPLRRVPRHVGRLSVAVGAAVVFLVFLLGSRLLAGGSVNTNTPACHLSVTRSDSGTAAVFDEATRNSSVNCDASSLLLRVTSGSAV